jgi:hypothetical protein
MKKKIFVGWKDPRDFKLYENMIWVIFLSFKFWYDE